MNSEDKIIYRPVDLTNTSMKPEVWDRLYKAIPSTTDLTDAKHRKELCQL